MLGMYPIGSRPIAALPRRTTGGPSYAVLAATGVAAMAATMSAQARMTVSPAGVGSFSIVSGPASGVMSSAGVGTFSPVLSASAGLAVTSAGIGTLSASLSAQARMAVSAAGAGAFAPVIAAKASGTTTMQGWATMGGSDNPSSAARFAGTGALAAVSYAFYADAEKAAPKQEVRVVFVPYTDRHPVEPPTYAPSEPRATYAQPENRVVVVPFENRVYEVSSKLLAPRLPNRRRTL